MANSHVGRWFGLSIAGHSESRTDNHCSQLLRVAREELKSWRMQRGRRLFSFSLIRHGPRLGGMNGSAAKRCVAILLSSPGGAPRRRVRKSSLSCATSRSTPTPTPANRSHVRKQVHDDSSVRRASAISVRALITVPTAALVLSSASGHPSRSSARQSSGRLTRPILAQPICGDGARIAVQHRTPRIRRRVRK